MTDSMPVYPHFGLADLDRKLCDSRFGCSWGSQLPGPNSASCSSCIGLSVPTIWTSPDQFTRLTPAGYPVSEKTDANGLRIGTLYKCHADFDVLHRDGGDCSLIIQGTEYPLGGVTSLPLDCGQTFLGVGRFGFMVTPGGLELTYAYQ